MKIWKKYKEHLLRGEWHIHSRYTDGKNTLFEYCEKATISGVPLIVFTDHVRKELDYNFNRYLEDIRKMRQEFSEIIILSGCEAKVLSDGSLDVEDHLLERVDYPIFAYHNFPKNKELYLKTLRKVMKNKYINTWTHPGLFLKNNGFIIGNDELIKIFELMRDYDILLEINKRYELPPESWIEKGKNIGIQFVRGSDIHSANELEPFEKK